METQELVELLENADTDDRLRYVRLLALAKKVYDKRALDLSNFRGSERNKLFNLGLLIKCLSANLKTDSCTSPFKLSSEWLFQTVGKLPLDSMENSDSAESIEPNALSPVRQQPSKIHARSKIQKEKDHLQGDIASDCGDDKGGGGRHGYEGDDGRNTESSESEDDDKVGGNREYDPLETAYKTPYKTPHRARRKRKGVECYSSAQSPQKKRVTALNYSNIDFDFGGSSKTADGRSHSSARRSTREAARWKKLSSEKAVAGQRA
jgi:hypothetical protein